MEEGNGGEVVVVSRGDDFSVIGGGGGSPSTVGLDSTVVISGGTDGGGGFGGSNGVVKKKRGRPKKMVSVGVLDSGDADFVKKKRGRPRGSQNIPRFSFPDIKVAESRAFVSCFPSYSSLITNRREAVKEGVGSNFRPYVEIVHTGEDVVGKILSFSQKGSGAICVLSATGIVSTVTINQPGSSSCGTLTYEGRFEILSLSGSYMFCETSNSTHKMGMMSVSLAKSDGGVFGGAISGSLVAAGPVQLVVGCFNQSPKEEPRHGSVEMGTAAPMAGRTGPGWTVGSARLSGVDDFSENRGVSSSDTSEPENEAHFNTTEDHITDIPSIDNSWTSLNPTRLGPD